jgi:hypothetical protein
MRKSKKAWSPFRIEWFRGPDPDATSPEIAEIAKSRRVVEESPPAPLPVPEPIVEDRRQEPRMIFIKNGELWERMPNGSVWPAVEGGESKDPAVAWRKAREKEINFT